MASYSTTMILLSVLFSGLLYANGRAVDLVSTLTQQSQFDFFTLALQWPATFCSTHENKCCPENGCCAGEHSQSPPGFTIHGLWPDYKNGSWPSCCEGAAYDESKIAPLLDAMHKYWPILSCNDISSCNNKTNSFWADQWEQHGTCSTSVTGDQYGYFLTALELYLKYNVTEVLLQAKVKPSNSNTYPSAVLISAIENAFHAKPQLDCKNGDVIKEVRLCFTKDLQPRECVEPTSCPANVRLPKFAFLEGATKTEDWLLSAVKTVV
ncbi:putative ribonuclease T(2) [Helianthus annuus]|uniref:Putative ribonuclease T2-like protein n=1 Tax=Helianthus annuus TaxID=4232 RepID=A0A251U857_HELAN|nr:ribonuclease 2 isoform X1 [Helianthus annuus]KAF5796136.1 putative ribonuclease T(2) [Helianthus annuus]KAJ0554244.1 putative ribonuclease T(2) [Helianthus annuus]KAJ0898732.1 putative ribonuclease T(2) [Helianthus annuus]KAJ0902365.1 putative ribonuclease T(2) [Helianthus annuus]